MTQNVSVTYEGTVMGTVAGSGIASGTPKGQVSWSTSTQMDAPTFSQGGAVTVNWESSTYTGSVYTAVFSGTIGSTTPYTAFWRGR